MTPFKTQEYLDSFINYELHLEKVSAPVFKLDRVKKLLNLLGDPQKKFKIIHIAGSKGKGSTCAFTAHILAKAGYRVGLYTSPHLNHYRERIRILENNRRAAAHSALEIFSDMISEKDLSRILAEIKPAIEKIRFHKTPGNLSFFEVLTVLALYYFRKKNVDFAVLETGLGGRFDATNAVSSLVCAITPISLEHTHILGNTLSQIAREKAAIIKPENKHVVIAPQEKEAGEIFARHCRNLNISPRWAGKEIKYRRLRPSLLGRHQIVNAAAAVGIIECLKDLGFVISSQSVRQGIQETFWPGRFEVIQERPFVILDGAHNLASVKAVVKTFQEIWPRKKAKLILGVSSDKNQKAICRGLNKIAESIVVTMAQHPRAADLDKKEIRVIFKRKEFVSTKNIKEALRFAFKKSKAKDVILVTGSLFVVSETRRYLKINRNI